VKSACAPSLPTATSASGKLYRRTGKRQEAREHLTTAAAMYREMDMRFWLEPGLSPLPSKALHILSLCVHGPQ